MNKLVMLASVLAVLPMAYAMEIVPPEMVVRQVITHADPAKLPGAVDSTKIRMANSNYTERVISALLQSLNTDDLQIQKPDRITDLTVHVVAPRRVDFLFEARHSKWVDGSDFIYYVIIGIEERTTPPAASPDSMPAHGRREGVLRHSGRDGIAKQAQP